MKIDVLGVKVNVETKSEIISQIASRLKENQKTFIVTPYSESLVAAQKDEEFRRVLNSADISLPDGIGVVLAARWTKAGIIRERIPGREFVWDLAELASKNNYSIFLLGGFGDTPERAAAALKAKFPNLRISGTASPLPNPPPQGEGMGTGEPYSQGKATVPDFCLPLEGGGKEGVIKMITNARPDFLFVALGPIKQEKWIANYLRACPAGGGVKLAIGLGGTFDYLAGKRPLAPRFWASVGLEWLWRLLTQPWRAVRIIKGVFGIIWLCLKSE